MLQGCYDVGFREHSMTQGVRLVPGVDRGVPKTKTKKPGWLVTYC